MLEEMICVGRLRGAFGVRGEVRAKSYLEEVDGLGRYEELRDEDGRRYGLSGWRRVGGGEWACCVEGVEDRESATALGGRKLYAPRESLPELGKDEYYWGDLEGLEARDDEGVVLGVITRVRGVGGGCMLDVELAGGGEATAPFTKAGVLEVDVSGGYVRVALGELVSVEVRVGGGDLCGERRC